MIFQKYRIRTRCPVCRKREIMNIMRSRDFRYRNGRLYPIGSQEVLVCNNCNYGEILDEK